MEVQDISSQLNVTFNHLLGANDMADGLAREGGVFWLNISFDV